MIGYAMMPMTMAMNDDDIDGQSCKMSQIWQIYLCKNIKKIVGIQKDCGNTKQVVVGIQNR